MKVSSMITCACCLFIGGLAAQTIEIQPYLQDVEPTSAILMWQTNFGEESIVEYGLSSDLGMQSKGTATRINYDEVRVHTVQLLELDRFKTYFYRVRTNDAVSDIFQFKTPPFATDLRSFKLVAMSDMQIDNNRPDQFREVVEDGVIKYFTDLSPAPLSDQLALVMVPGDLVTTGTIFHQWRDHFFNPAETLFPQIPLYPVPGNHERNSEYFFKYFSLPENGTPAYAEHWWYKDYGNLRILGMDSNDGYDNLSQQMDWLDSTLLQTEKMEHIDFVFAQMHHPHKSELWIPGESKFTGKVVARLEAFTKRTGKPSIHFFGHTHGYSRGQSKDHQHLWVNVASAGGAIDNWGEYSGRDYEEFTVTQDEYGFVLVEVDPNPEDPKFTLKRISRGNKHRLKDNEVTDSITVWKNRQAPDRPQAIGPSGQIAKLYGIELSAGPFVGGRPASFHAGSQWQVSSTSQFEEMIVDSWKQHENWYYNVNQQAGDDLTDEKIYQLLKPGQKYFWRVRYRDQFLNWSDWSSAAEFSTP